MSDIDRFREALAKIAEIASAAANGESGYEEPAEVSHSDDYGCTLKSIPTHLIVDAAENAVRINPVNAPLFGQAGGFAMAAGAIPEPLFIAISTTKYWGPFPRRLSVSFMEPAASDLRRRVISHLNAWTRTGCIEFIETQGTGDVRISRERGGYWSYLGTDIQLIPRDQPTMNLEGFTMSTPESEYKRVVRHEAGHTLGMPHEHMRQDLVSRIDPIKAYDYFLRTQGWSRQVVNQQVLTSLDERSLMSTPPDQTSIMCYQLPGSITRDGRPITGGRDINQTDYDFVARVYPKPGRQTISEEEAVVSYKYATA